MAARGSACSGRNGSAALSPAVSGTDRLTATWAPQSGFGLETDQSLPAHSAAPEASSEPNGYCQPDRRSPRKGIVSSSICGSCAAHSGWMFAAAPSPAKRPMSSGCTTCTWAR